MHTDLRTFLLHLAGAVALTLVPVVLTAFLIMPSTLHHQLGHPSPGPSAPTLHMT